MKKELDSTKKCTLLTHDTQREVMAHIGFTTAVAKRDNPLMVVVEAESAQYNKMILGVKEEAEESGEWTAVGKDVPCSAHVLIAIAEFLADSDKVVVAPTELEAVTHQAHMVQLRDHLEEKGVAEATKAAGTLMIRKNKRRVKLIMKPCMDEKMNTSLFYMIRRAGAVIHTGKAPREGIFRVLQSTVPSQ